MVRKTTASLLTLSLRFLFTVIISVSLCSISFGQNANAPQSSSLNYFKIEIGIIIDCPVLPMRLHDQLMTLKDIKDYNKDNARSCITFNVPEGTVTKEQIMNMAISSGFPAKMVTILMDNKPFAN